MNTRFSFLNAGQVQQPGTTPSFRPPWDNSGATSDASESGAVSRIQFNTVSNLLTNNAEVIGKPLESYETRLYPVVPKSAAASPSSSNERQQEKEQNNKLPVQSKKSRNSGKGSSDDEEDSDEDEEEDESDERSDKKLEEIKIPKVDSLTAENRKHLFFVKLSGENDEKYASACPDTGVSVTDMYETEVFRKASEYSVNLNFNFESQNDDLKLMAWETLSSFLLVSASAFIQFAVSHAGSLKLNERVLVPDGFLCLAIIQAILFNSAENNFATVFKKYITKRHTTTCSGILEDIALYLKDHEQLKWMLTGPDSVVLREYGPCIRHHCVTCFGEIRGKKDTKISTCSLPDEKTCPTEIVNFMACETAKVCHVNKIQICENNHSNRAIFRSAFPLYLPRFVVSTGTIETVNNDWSSIGMTDIPAGPTLTGSFGKYRVLGYETNQNVVFVDDGAGVNNNVYYVVIKNNILQNTFVDSFERKDEGIKFQSPNLLNSYKQILFERTE